MRNIKVLRDGELVTIDIETIMPGDEFEILDGSKHKCTGEPIYDEELYDYGVLLIESGVNFFEEGMVVDYEIEKEQVREGDVKANKRICQGYEIIQSMQLETPFGEAVEVVLGHNPKAPAPFVTWVSYEWNEGFAHGHYFTNKENAVRDMFERGLEKAGIDLREKYREERAVDDIKITLEEGFTAPEIEKLMENKQFMKMAMDVYDDMDHSRENEILFNDIESHYIEWCNEVKIFDIETILSMLNHEVTVLREDGKEVVGYPSFDFEESLSRFYVFGKDANGDNISSEIDIKDVSSIKVGDEVVFLVETIDFRKTRQSLDEKIGEAKKGVEKPAEKKEKEVEFSH